LPIRHEGGGNLPLEGVLAYLRAQAKVFTGDLVGANLPYDLDFLAGDGIEFERVRRLRRDCMSLSPWGNRSSVGAFSHNSAHGESAAQTTGARHLPRPCPTAMMVPCGRYLRAANISLTIGVLSFFSALASI
jgi:hypothetical protein